MVVSEDPACKRQTRTTSDAAKRAQDLHRCSACSRGQPWLVGRAMDGWIGGWWGGCGRIGWMGRVGREHRFVGCDRWLVCMAVVKRGVVASDGACKVEVLLMVVEVVWCAVCAWCCGGCEHNRW